MSSFKVRVGYSINSWLKNHYSYNKRTPRIRGERETRPDLVMRTNTIVTEHQIVFRRGL